MSALDELTVPQLRSIAKILDLKPRRGAKKPAILGSINKHLGTGVDPKYEEWTRDAALTVAKARGLAVAEQDENNIKAIAAVMRAADDLQPQTRSKSPIRLDGSSGSSSPKTVIHQPDTDSGSPPTLVSEAEAGAGSSSAGAEPAKRGRDNSPSQVGGADNASDSAQNPNKKPEITAGERPVESDVNMSEADAANPAAVQAKTLHDKATDHANKAIKNALKSKSVTNPQESEAALTEAQKEAELAKASAQALNSQKTADQDQKEHANASAAIAAGVTANANAEHQRQPSAEAASEQAGPSQIPAPVEIPGNKGASGVGPLVVARKGGDKEFLSSSVKPTNLSKSGQKFLQEAEAFLRAASTRESTVISNFRDTLSPSKPRDASAPSAETTPDKDSEPVKTSEIYVHPPNETKWKASEFSWEDHFESITIVPAPDLNKPNPNRPRLGFTDVGPFTNDPERWVNFADPWTGQRYDGFVLNISKKQQLMVEYGGNSNARQSRGVMLPVPSYRQQRTQFEKWLKKGSVEIQHGHEEDLAGLNFKDLDIERCIVFEFLTPSEYDLRDADVRVLIRTTRQSEDSHNQFYTRSQLERTLGSAMKQWIQENRPTPQQEHAADNKMERKAKRGSKRSGKQDHDMSQRLLRLEEYMEKLGKLLDTHA